MVSLHCIVLGAYVGTKKFELFCSPHGMKYCQTSARTKLTLGTGSVSKEQPSHYLTPGGNKPNSRMYTECLLHTESDVLCNFGKVNAPAVLKLSPQHHQAHVKSESRWC